MKMTMGIEASSMQCTVIARRSRLEGFEDIYASSYWKSRPQYSNIVMEDGWNNGA